MLGRSTNAAKSVFIHHICAAISAFGAIIKRKQLYVLSFITDECFIQVAVLGFKIVA